jgi:hypothetical protein
MEMDASDDADDGADATSDEPDSPIARRARSGAKGKQAKSPRRAKRKGSAARKRPAAATTTPPRVVAATAAVAVTVATPAAATASAPTTGKALADAVAAQPTDPGAEKAPAASAEPVAPAAMPVASKGPAAAPVPAKSAPKPVRRAIPKRSNMFIGASAPSTSDADTAKPAWQEVDVVGKPAEPQRKAAASSDSSRKRIDTAKPDVSTLAAAQTASGQPAADVPSLVKADGAAADIVKTEPAPLVVKDAHSPGKSSASKSDASKHAASGETVLPAPTVESKSALKTEDVGSPLGAAPGELPRAPSAPLPDPVTPGTPIAPLPAPQHEPSQATTEVGTQASQPLVADSAGADTPVPETPATPLGPGPARASGASSAPPPADASAPSSSQALQVTIPSSMPTMARQSSNDRPSSARTFTVIRNGNGDRGCACRATAHSLRIH